MPRAKIAYVRADSSETFALIPTMVMESEAYHALPDYAVRVLNALTQFNWTGYGKRYKAKVPGNNGDLSLTPAVAKLYGVGQTWKTVAGLQILRLTGLIEITRIGRWTARESTPNLYALSWLHVPYSPKHDLPDPHQSTRPPSNAWAHWSRPDDWDQLETRVRQRAQGKGGEARKSCKQPVWKKGASDEQPGLLGQRTTRVKKSALSRTTRV